MIDQDRIKAKKKNDAVLLARSQHHFLTLLLLHQPTSQPTTPTAHPLALENEGRCYGYRLRRRRPGFRGPKVRRTSKKSSTFRVQSVPPPSSSPVQFTGAKREI